MTLETDIMTEGEENFMHYWFFYTIFVFWKKNITGHFFNPEYSQVLLSCLNAAITQVTACCVHPSLHSWLRITFVAWGWERKVRALIRRKGIKNQKRKEAHFNDFATTQPSACCRHLLILKCGLLRQVSHFLVWVKLQHN